jgi:hemoglobin-like flavoprotein
MSTPSSRAPTKAQLAAAEQWLINLQDDTAALIRSGWSAAIAASGDLAADFYQNLFAAAPAVIDLFSGDMTEQQARLVHTLEETVALVHQPEHLLLLLRASGVRHHHYQVKQAYFGVMRNILIDTLATRASLYFTAAHRAAWEGFFDNMATVMQHGMASAAKN